MPNLGSAKKRVRQTAKRTERNKIQRGLVRTAVRHVERALLHHQATEAAAALPAAMKTLDKVAGKGVIHKNKAARKKSRLARRVAALQKSAPQAK